MSSTADGRLPEPSPAPAGLASAAVGYALVACAATMWGLWPLVLRSAEKIAPMSSALESAILMVVIAIVSGPLALRDRVPRKATLREWLGVGWLGVADAMNSFFFFKAYQRTSVAVAVLTHYLTPLFVAIGAPLLLHEHLSRRTYAAAVLGFVGLVLLLEPWRGGAQPAGLYGALFGAASAFFYASNVLMTKRLVHAFSGSEQMLFHCFVAVPLLVALVPRAEWSTVDPRAAGLVALGSLGPGALASLFFVWGLRRVPASRASTLTLLEPLVAVVVVGLIVYGETLGALGFLGGALILAGAALVISKRD